MRTRTRSQEPRRACRPPRRAPTCARQPGRTTAPDVSPGQLQFDFSTAAPTALVDECAFCREHLGQPCQPCERLARRIYALQLEGVTLPDIAARFGLTAEFASELLAEEEDRVAFAATRVEPVPNAELRRLCAELAADDPGIYVRIAERGGWASPSDVRRLLGLQLTSRKTVRGRVYPGRLLTDISPHAAGRIARAIGLLPLEVDWPEASSYGAIRPLVVHR
jgi:hypothetical protein